MARRIPKITPEFLAGAQVGRDKFKTVTIERDELAEAEKAAELKPHLKVAEKIWTDFKWECKKQDHTVEQLLELIDDYIIKVGLAVKHVDLRRQVIAEFQKMKEKLKNPE